MMTTLLRMFKRALPCAVAVGAACLFGQTPSTASMTPQQTKLLIGAQKDAKAHDFAQALAKMNKLLKERPTDVSVVESAAETAIDAGSFGEALALLKPLADAGNWRAHLLLARAYQETRKDDQRDGEMAILRVMQETTTDPALRDLQEVLVDRVQLPFYCELFVYDAIKPWGENHIYESGSARDAYGKEYYHLVLQSSDGDQPDLQSHRPDEAPRAGRQFTLDGYNESRPNGGGGAHKVFTVFEEKPDFTQVKNQMVEIATHYPHERQSGVAPGGVEH